MTERSPKSWAEVDHRANTAEILKLRQLLSRWQAQSKYLFDCYDTSFGKWQSAELESIIKKTNEVLGRESEE